MSSDEDLIESNVRTDSAFPLRHRLLTNEQFHMNRHWESVLTPAAEVSALLQTHDGVSLEEAHMFMDALFKAMSAPRLQIVSRRDNEETWKDVMGSSLNPMFQKIRSIFATEAAKRFKLTGTPNEHILLALKMSPFVDTSENSENSLFAPTTLALMDAAYMKALRMRYLHIRSSALASSASSHTPYGAAIAATPMAALDAATPIAIMAAPNAAVSSATIYTGHTCS